MTGSKYIHSSGLSSGYCKHSSPLLTAPASMKSLVLKKTVQKWIQDNDKSLSILTWLDFEMDGDGIRFASHNGTC